MLVIISAYFNQKKISNREVKENVYIKIYPLLLFCPLLSFCWLSLIRHGSLGKLIRNTRDDVFQHLQSVLCLPDRVSSVCSVLDTKPSFGLPLPLMHNKGEKGLTQYIFHGCAVSHLFLLLKYTTPN